ncbi:MAG: hypothetical protein CVU44_22340 [Chloroflexi bacterium HGW-Chloroflexi-6]|nr:MAG: hypothetical protein CVU44_22340 [Chloroflexi bacterium HGW-Chloroflexi-6]
MSEQVKREEIRKLVETIYENSLARSFWRAIGRFFATIFRSRREMPVSFSSLLTIVISVLFTFLLALILGAQNFFNGEFGAFILLTAGWVWVAIVLSDWQIQQSIKVIREDVVNLLDLAGDQNIVKSWAELIGNRRVQFFVALFWFLMILGLSVFELPLDFARPDGWILALHLALGLLWFVFQLSWFGALILFYGYYLGRLPLNLFPDDPSATPGLLVIHQDVGQLLFVSAFIAALAIPIGMVVGFLSGMVLITSAITLWIPLMMFFVATERSFSVQISYGKNRRLAELQAQISQLENRLDLPGADMVKAIEGLLALHDRVKRAPDSLVNLGSLINLIGSMAMPLVSALLNLLSTWQKFFGFP